MLRKPTSKQYFNITNNIVEIWKQMKKREHLFSNKLDKKTILVTRGYREFKICFPLKK